MTRDEHAFMRGLRQFCSEWEVEMEEDEEGWRFIDTSGEINISIETVSDEL